MMYEGSYRHVPVVEDGRPVGMISAATRSPGMEDFDTSCCAQAGRGHSL